MNPSLHCWQGWLGRLIACCKNCVVHCVLEKSGLHGVSVRVPLGCVRNTYKWWVLPNEAVNYFPFQAFSLHHHFPLLPSIRPRASNGFRCLISLLRLLRHTTQPPIRYPLVRENINPPPFRLEVSLCRRQHFPTTYSIIWISNSSPRLFTTPTLLQA